MRVEDICDREQGEEGNVLGEDGGNGLARAAPCRKGIDDDLGMILEDLVELGLAVVGGRNARATVSSLDDFPAGQYPLVVEKKDLLGNVVDTHLDRVCTESSS